MASPKETMLYKMCVNLYKEHEEVNKHAYNEGFKVLLQEAIDYLRLDTYKVKNDIIVTFILDANDFKDDDDDV